MPSIVIFVIQITVFGAAALYLHYLSDHYGLSPLLFFIAGLMGVLNIVELISLFVEPVAGLVIRPGGHVYVPIILLTVLIVYIASGARTARITILGLSGINVMVLSVLFFLFLYVNIREADTSIRGLFATQDILTPLFLRGVVASTITFIVNMFVIVIVYQGIKNTFPGLSDIIVPGIALLMSLWVDSVLYNILAFLGTPSFTLGVPGDVVMKTMAGFLLAPLAGWYLARVAPTLTGYQGAANRSTWMILFGEGGTSRQLLQLENELKVSRAIYEQIMQHIEEIFWLADLRRARLLYLSPNFEKLTGEPREAFYKDPISLLKLVHPEDRSVGLLRQILNSPETEFRIRHVDGSMRWMRNRSFPIITQDQEIVRYAGITEDITLRKDMQAKSLDLELSREKVRLLHDFVEDASHDLRTPLATMLLKLDLLERADAERQKGIRVELRDAVKRLSSLIDDLFTLSQLESGEPAEAQMVDLNELVRLVRDNYQDLARQRNLEMVAELADPALRISGEQTQLLRLVTNLVENAINYTEHGRITLRTALIDGQAVLEVVDTGVGIAEKDHASVFQRFYRAKQARSMRPDGTGLGLAICKAITEQHGGTITFESASGQGTTFRAAFRIPEIQQAQAAMR